MLWLSETKPEPITLSFKELCKFNTHTAEMGDL